MNKNWKFSYLKPVRIYLILLFLAAGNISAQDNKNKNVLISKIEITGNKKTKDNIILRELTFKENEYVASDKLPELTKQSKINLLKTPLFNYVSINYEITDSANAEITVKVEERWYLWPQAAVYYVDRNFSNWLKDKDFSRIDAALGLEKYNIRGRNEKLKLYVLFGYDEELIFKYDNFYFDKKRKHSGAVFLKQLRRKETSCAIENDKVKRIKLIDAYALKSYNITFKYSFRKNIHNINSFYFGFEHRSVADSLLLCNPHYFTGYGNSASYMFLKYIFLNDKRDSRIFPLTGYNIKITATKNGLFMFPESEINSLKLKGEFSKYIQINKKLYFAGNMTFQKTAGEKNPFFLNTALGYSSNIRGYEYYAINGTDFFLFKNTLNFKVLSKRTFQIKFLPWDKINKPYIKIYADIFADAAYVKNTDTLYNTQNYLTNKFLYGIGAGINILTYYDWLFRIDFSVNRQKESGIYLHFEAPF